jgi:hypothetical protein
MKAVRLHSIARTATPATLLGVDQDEIKLLSYDEESPVEALKRQL